jgi:hypothetical protein
MMVHIGGTELRQIGYSIRKYLAGDVLPCMVAHLLPAITSWQRYSVSVEHPRP